MPVVQVLADLPYAGYLEPHDGELAPGAEYTEIHVEDTELEDCQAAGAHVTESAFTGVTFTGGTFRRGRLHDVWLSKTRWVGTSLAETGLLDVTFLDSYLAGVEAYGATLRGVRFQECKVDTLNLRAAKLRDVVFDRCELKELDLGGSTLSGVAFPGSALRRARFTGATLTNVDLRGTTELDVAEGADSLRGALIDSRQLAELAPVLAHTLGIVVKDG
jgi:uncharacterized protein YjbI with pentapeptide repeats